MTKIHFALIFITLLNLSCLKPQTIKNIYPRETISINYDWKFFKYSEKPDSLIYDIRPEVIERNDDKVADSKPTEAVEVTPINQLVLKPWILPSGNEFINEQNKRHLRPPGNPGEEFEFVKIDYDDSKWQNINLPHDWAIEGPFQTGPKAEVGGGMGRLPSHGVSWYRKKLEFTELDRSKKIFLDIDGAMSYAMVWLNGKLVGGWPYGYNSFRLDLTPFIIFGKSNQLSIRLDNPPNSSRWYPGGGIYRNVWLIKTNHIHVKHWGSQVTCSNITKNSADINLKLKIANETRSLKNLKIISEIFEFESEKNLPGKQIAQISTTDFSVPPNHHSVCEKSVTISNPKLWGPYPEQEQHLYMIITKIYDSNALLDIYETKFGIRNIKMDPSDGLIVNGEKIIIKGVNQHHDLGALGAAFNVRAAERQLEILRDLGCNAIRMAHNPPAPELLDLTDKMGFLVIDEVFDSWERKKTPLDFHLIFPEWYEQDIRSFIRRDKNHPSIIAWSFGNEVGEQYTDQEGANLARKLIDIVHDEDPTRPATASMNYARPNMPFPAMMDIINLNYQGEGIRDAPAYEHLRGIKTSPLYPAFREKFPDKMIISSETASALSSRGAYKFPVFDGLSAPVSDNSGGDPQKLEVSAYELYTAAFGSSADKVFASQDKHPYVAGEFVWSGWDYLGEPTPYYGARSSYSGIIDLAGFKKDRFYLYRSRWREDLPMVHILPHWNWPDRIGQITPIHIFTSGDEIELFVNNKSMGRKKKGQYEYRLRWDDITYSPGEVKAVAYKKGQKWAEEIIRTTGPSYKVSLSADKSILNSNNNDLVFITAEILDSNNFPVPNAENTLTFSCTGSGKILATDNGNPADMNAFTDRERKAYYGKALCIIGTEKGNKGKIILNVSSPGLESNSIEIVVLED